MREDVSPWVPPLARRFEDAARLLHAYEVRGAEHIPLEGPGLFVFYHGFMPLDAWFFGAWVYNELGRLPHALADRWMFKAPGIAWLSRTAGMVPGNRADAVRFLREGHLVGVSPGGTREALTGRRRHYQLVWGHREGFAAVALEADVPMFPVFTENIEEIYRSPFVELPPLQALYERTRWPIVPVAGMGLLPIPAKLTTWVGPPVHPRASETPAELKARIGAALEELMAAHQHRRPRIPRAVLQRLRHRR